MTSDSESVSQLITENQRLVEEINYYREILFADVTPSGISMFNALRQAVDIAEENSRLRSGEEFKRIQAECQELRDEIVKLKRLGYANHS